MVYIPEISNGSTFVDVGQRMCEVNKRIIWPNATLISFFWTVFTEFAWFKIAGLTICNKRLNKYLAFVFSCNLSVFKTEMVWKNFRSELYIYNYWIKLTGIYMNVKNNASFLIDQKEGGRWKACLSQMGKVDQNLKSITYIGKASWSLKHTKARTWYGLATSGTVQLWNDDEQSHRKNQEKLIISVS